MNNRKEDFTFRILSILILFICLVSLILFLHHHVDKLLDSDDASEMILGEMLAKENSILSRNWYYSTELRVLNTNLIYPVFFKLSNNWHLIRICTQICQLSLFLLSYYWLNQVLCRGTFFALSGSILFVPFSEVWFSYSLKSGFYLPFISIIFLSLALWLQYFRETGQSEIQQKRRSILNQRKKEAALFFAVFLSVLAGMGGLRLILILYIPLFCVGITEQIILFSKVRPIMKNHKLSVCKDFLFCSLVFLGSIAGYLVNTLFLSHHYHFMSWSMVSWTGFNWDRTVEVLHRFLNCYGLMDGKTDFPSFCRNIISFFLLGIVMISIVYVEKNRSVLSKFYHKYVLFTLWSYIIFISLFAFTDMPFDDGNGRYNLPLIPLSIPLIVIFFKEIKWRDTVKKWILIGIVLSLMINGVLFYAEKAQANENSELQSITILLKREGYKAGYASFWNGNVITELSNGEIEMWVWGDTGKKGEQSQKTESNHLLESHFQWLQKVSHDELTPEGKVFLLFYRSEFEDLDWNNKDLKNNIIYHSEKYVVIGFYNYDLLSKNLLD